VEGAKSLCWGFYDGVVGLVVDPIDGALREGPIGFAKGCGRGGEWNNSELPSAPVY